MNIVNDKITDYLRSFHRPVDDDLEELRNKCVEGRIPLILPETEDFLRVLLSITRPSGILEVGTAWGYSSALFAKLLPDAMITTIEKSERVREKARFNHEQMGVASRIDAVQGDGGEVLKYMADMREDREKVIEDLLRRVQEDPETAFAGAPTAVDEPDWEPDIMTESRIEDISRASEGTYDFLFIDAAKSHYREFLDQGLRLLEPGSVILCDNVLMKASVIDDGYDGHRRHRTNVKRMHEFIEYLCGRADLETVIMSCGDGLALSRMI
ncbi:O-methyltransferase [Mobilibacterium timonense]|uniref:O-methyltransferase n=1 Tax=Mobilibacterium timonense TaxID=1871012 RepID=UPI0009845E93|nr:class I SAM-dependent methyltransferase [Mobilibacterium timonense]